MKHTELLTIWHCYVVFILFVFYFIIFILFMHFCIFSTMNILYFIIRKNYNKNHSPCHNRILFLSISLIFARWQSAVRKVYAFFPAYTMEEREPFLQPRNKRSLQADWVSFCHMPIPGPKQLLREWYVLIG